MPVLTEAAAREAAASLVEQQLKGPVALVVGDTVRLYSDDEGTVLLPMQPVVNVSQIAYDTGQTQDLTTVIVDHQVVSGLPRLIYATFTYDHGWTDEAVPAIVRVILDRLTQRLLRTADDNVRAESVGGYRVEYQTGPAWLTQEEMDALDQCSRVVSPRATSTSTARIGPSYSPAFWGDWW